MGAHESVPTRRLANEPVIAALAPGARQRAASSSDGFTLVIGAARNSPRPRSDGRAQTVSEM